MVTGKRKIPHKETTPQEKVAKIFNKVCPDIKLANKRTDKLNTRNVYDTNSIKTSKGAKPIGAPGGKNKLSKCLPCFKIPNMFIPKKIANAVQKVTIK
jgi:hypothetical protein